VDGQKIIFIVQHVIIQGRKAWQKYDSFRCLKRITDPKLRGADCETAPVAAKIVTYPEKRGDFNWDKIDFTPSYSFENDFVQLYLAVQF
jgi:hypothetical protein